MEAIVISNMDLYKFNLELRQRLNEGWKANPNDLKVCMTQKTNNNETTNTRYSIMLMK